MSTWGLLSQFVSARGVGLEQSRQYNHIMECNLFSAWYRWKIIHLPLNSTDWLTDCHSLTHCLYQVRVITVFTVFRLLTDFVCLYNYEFWLSLCKIVRSSVILLLPSLTHSLTHSNKPIPITSHQDRKVGVKCINIIDRCKSNYHDIVDTETFTKFTKQLL
jgi:hypothetical protein